MFRRESKVRTIILSGELDEIIEATRVKLGMNRGQFYKYAALKLLLDREGSEIVDADMMSVVYRLRQLEERLRLIEIRVDALETKRVRKQHAASQR